MKYPKYDPQPEMDSIIQYENVLILITLKSGCNAKLKSLHHFMQKTDHSIAVRDWSN